MRGFRKQGDLEPRQVPDESLTEQCRNSLKRGANDFGASF
jgi:hypothetical protein